jgi:hypothetical protein
MNERDLPGKNRGKDGGGGLALILAQGRRLLTTANEAPHSANINRDASKEAGGSNNGSYGTELASSVGNGSISATAGSGSASASILVARSGKVKCSTAVRRPLPLRGGALAALAEIASSESGVGSSISKNEKREPLVSLLRTSPPQGEGRAQQFFVSFRDRNFG